MALDRDEQISLQETSSYELNEQINSFSTDLELHQIYTCPSAVGGTGNRKSFGVCLFVFSHLASINFQLLRRVVVLSLFASRRSRFLD